MAGGMRRLSAFWKLSKVKVSPLRNEIDVEIKTVLKRHYTESYACAKEAGKVVPEVFRKESNPVCSMETE